MNHNEYSFFLLVGFILSAFFSGVETGSYSLNRIRLRHDVREKERSALRLEALLAYPHRFIFTMLIGNNLAIYLVSQQTTQLYLNQGMQSNYLWGLSSLECGNGSNCYVDDPALFIGGDGAKKCISNKCRPVDARVIGADAFGFMDNFSVGMAP